MRCASCHQEIMVDDPAVCPYCYSTNLVPIDNYFFGNEAENNEYKPILKSPRQKLREWFNFTTILGIIIFVFGWAILVWNIYLYGSEFVSGALRPNFLGWLIVWVVGTAVVVLGYSVATREKD